MKKRKNRKNGVGPKHVQWGYNAKCFYVLRKQLYSVLAFHTNTHEAYSRPHSPNRMGVAAARFRAVPFHVRLQCMPVHERMKQKNEQTSRTASWTASQQLGVQATEFGVKLICLLNEYDKVVMSAAGAPWIRRLFWGQYFASCAPSPSEGLFFGHVLSA